MTDPTTEARKVMTAELEYIQLNAAHGTAVRIIDALAAAGMEITNTLEVNKKLRALTAELTADKAPTPPGVLSEAEIAAEVRGYDGMRWQETRNLAADTIERLVRERDALKQLWAPISEAAARDQLQPLNPGAAP